MKWEELKKSLAKVPPWGWAVGVGGLLLALLFFRRNQAPANVGVVQPDQPAGPAVPPSNGVPVDQPRTPSMEDWQLKALLGLIGQNTQALSSVGAWMQRLSTSPTALTSNNGTMTSGGGAARPASASAVERAAAREEYDRSIARRQNTSFNENFTGYGFDDTAMTPAYDPRQDTKRVFDPLNPGDSLLAPAERTTQPYAPPPGGFELTKPPTEARQPVVTEDETMQRLRDQAAGKPVAPAPPVDLVYDEKKHGPGYKGPI